jgi:chemotaxis protein methyltransferase CheR
VIAAASFGWAASMRPLTQREFRLFQGLIEAEAGIFLSEAKTALRVGRLARRLRELGCESFGEYYARVQEDEQERSRMLDCICTNETEFFREPQHFEFLEKRVFPEWQAQMDAGRRARSVRVWSAGCSSGEEPYSLAMTLLAHFPPEQGYKVEILATDLSNRVLQRAREAIWPLEKSRKIPPAYLKRFMLRGVGSQLGRMKAGPEIRSVVRLQRLNLNDNPVAVVGPFDLVFCRNVLIYFAAPQRQQVLDQLLQRLIPGGFLFLGHAETLHLQGDRAHSVMPTVYQLAPTPSRAASPAARS